MTDPAPGRQFIRATFRVPLALVDNGMWRFAGIAASSFVAGLMEAAALILLTQVAVGSAADLSALPLGLDISPESTLAICAVMLVGKLLLSALGMRLGAGMASEALVNSRKTLLDTFLRSSWSAQSTDRLGDLQQTLTVNVDRVAFMILSATAVISSGLSVVVMLGSSLVISPMAALITIAAGSLLFIGLRPLGDRAKRSATLNARAGRRYATQVTEVARLAREVKVHAVEQPVADQIADLSAESAATWKRRGSRGPVTAAVPVHRAPAGRCRFGNCIRTRTRSTGIRRRHRPAAREVGQLRTTAARSCAATARTVAIPRRTR